MVLQTTGVISFSNLKTEFVGSTVTNTIKFSEYYCKGLYVPEIEGAGIPTVNNVINLSSFYGKRNKMRSLFARYTGNGPFAYSTASKITTWQDISGNARHISGTNVKGYPYSSQESRSSLNLRESSGSYFNTVRGVSTDGFKIPFLLPQKNLTTDGNTYTIAYMARYVGTATESINKNIFTSADGVSPVNWWGFSSSQVGRSITFKADGTQNSAITVSGTKQSIPNQWLIGVETEKKFRFNSVDWTATTAASVARPAADTTFTINCGPVAYCGSWEVAELVFYNRALTQEEIIILENYFAYKYAHLSFSYLLSDGLANFKSTVIARGFHLVSGWFDQYDGKKYQWNAATQSIVEVAIVIT